MSMAAQEVDRASWNEALLRLGGSFLQSFEWGEFQASLGRQVFRLRSASFQALLIRQELPLGRSYLYCPRGPLALRPQGPDESLLADLLERVRALRDGAIFLRIEPEWPGEGRLRGLLRHCGFLPSPRQIQPTRTIILDISRPEEEILASMKPKTRYNIRLAERKGVSVRRLGREDQGAFLRLLEETARRNRFRPYPSWYYQRMLEFLQGPTEGGPLAELWGAEYEGRLLAVNLMLFWGQRVTYLHGASSSLHRNLMAPALLHWRVMQEARRRGCREYDLWGISERWPGVTRFKAGFGGREIEYVGSYDLPLSRLWYRGYALLRRVL